MPEVIDPRTPVIVGSGQTLRRNESEGSCEPAEMIAEALRAAADDSGAGDTLVRRADSVRCVPVISWPYRDIATLVAELVGASPHETVLSCAVGGDGPQRLINDTCASIAAGELDVALVGGGESLAAVQAAQRAGEMLSWHGQEEGVSPTRVLDEPKQPINDAETDAILATPVMMYSLIESALGAAWGDGREKHAKRISGLWSRFSSVAARNPNAWIPHAFSPREIASASEQNRRVAGSYTKLLAANMQVNLASGLIVASAEAAQQAGVPRDRWVFVHSGAQAEEEWFVSQRRELAASPALGAVGGSALAHAGIGIDEVAEVDLYSCFPSAVQVAARELGLALDDARRPLTVTGGLTFAGGPGNNYTGHAVATMVQRLRENADEYGLTTAVGWYLSKHAAGVYSARPPKAGFRSLDSEPARPGPRRVVSGYSGVATIDAFTVLYRRDGGPEAAVISALTQRGERALARSDDPDLVAAAAETDLAGKVAKLDGAAWVSI